MAQIIAGEDERLLCSGERYTPNHSDQWHEISEMFSPRSNFATVILDDMIFVIGGYNGRFVRARRVSDDEGDDLVPKLHLAKDP
jgi:kelch-like protein 10